MLFNFSILKSQEEIDEEKDNLIKKKAPQEIAFITVHQVAEKYIKDKDWVAAIAVFEKYSKYFPNMRSRFEKTISLLRQSEELLTIANLGPGINTPQSEYGPIPTFDGRYLYFTGNRREDGFGGEDIYVSELKDSIWQKAVNLGSNINTRGNESPLSISADGNLLIIFGNYDGSFGSGDIFYSEKTGDSWGPVQHFPKPINSEYFDADAFLTNDGKALLFVSDRPGGIGELHRLGESFNGHFGNTDIYVCLRTPEGWSNPINLGPTINTPYADRTPFLHPDGKTLYFSSDGHYGLGGLDVFKSVRLSEYSWTDWSEPVNLGKEINTVGDDWGYMVATSGDIAYFSANIPNRGYGKDDIYSTTLPKGYRPEGVVIVSGKITDNNGNPLKVKLKWEDLSTGENVGQIVTSSKDGSFYVALPLGKKYGLFTEAEGYYAGSINVNLQDKVDSLKIKGNIKVISLKDITENGVSVRINNIFFDYDKFDLKAESYPELNRLAKLIKNSPKIKVEISGYTDNQGSDTYNQQLSKERASAVVKFLISVGCNKKNLSAKGYGKSNPVESNETEAGRAFNRRVEFKFLKKK
jgi:outer membrane protein OmpA-like peptidoglycan-associated protein